MLSANAHAHTWDIQLKLCLMLLLLLQLSSSRRCCYNKRIDRVCVCVCASFWRLPFLWVAFLQFKLLDSYFFPYFFWVQIEHKLHTELKMISHTHQAIIKMIIIAYSWYVDMPYNFQCFSMLLLLFPDWKSQQFFGLYPKTEWNMEKNNAKNPLPNSFIQYKNPNGELWNTAQFDPKVLLHIFPYNFNLSRW